MDAAEEIPQPVRPKKRSRVEGETLQHSPEQAAAVTKVFNDDNLLREIIVRVGFPSTLVRAALVCKRWLEQASDRKFLSRFRKRHPPRLLGCYITEEPLLSPVLLHAPLFVPILPEPPELAAVIRRLKSYNFGAHEIMHCLNDIVFTERLRETKCRRETKWTHGAHRPLCAEKGMQIVPPFPQDYNVELFTAIVSKDEGSGLTYCYVLGESAEEVGKSMAHVYTLQGGVWRMHTSSTCLNGLHFGPKALLVGNNIFVPRASGDGIIVLDLRASSSSTIQLPEGVKYHNVKTRLSQADDVSSLYLIHVEKLQLCIWLRKGDNWLLVDTICLHEMLATLGMSDYTLEDEGIANVHIRQVGDNCQFVFLQMGQCIFCLNIKSRTIYKVYENMKNDRRIGSVHPFMMMWPPTFPALKGDRARYD